MNDFFFDRDHLATLSERHRSEYQSADPFPHVVIDDFVPEWVLHRVLEEFSSPGETEWHHYQNKREDKLALSDEDILGPFTRHLLAQFNSSSFLEFLERLTGIDGLLTDPYYLGGGLHQIERGGYLKVHADFNWHDRLRVERRLNLLLYLNEGWKDEYGGHLELWDETMAVCQRRIIPMFNRCVVFNTTSTSYHGHPEPLTCPEGWTRKSIALYYYSAPVEQRGPNPHSTLFQGRPGEDVTDDGLSVRQALRAWVARRGAVRSARRVLGL